MSVKIEVVRESVGQERISRPWSVRDGAYGDSWAVDSNGRYVTPAVSREQARAVVDAVNNLPASKGKIEKFVVEMDPETFVELVALTGSVANHPARDFWKEGRQFVVIDRPGHLNSIGDAGSVHEAISGYRLMEDA